jgi:hypothetical protein
VYLIRALESKLKMPAASCKLHEMFDRREVYHFQIRSLIAKPEAPREAEPAGNGLAFAVHEPRHQNQLPVHTASSHDIN